MSVIEFESYSNSPKRRKRKDLNISWETIDKLILDNNDPAPKIGDPDYENLHNFLVTLCHQNKNLADQTENYFVEHSISSPKISHHSKNLKIAPIFIDLPSPSEIYEKYSFKASQSFNLSHPPLNPLPPSKSLKQINSARRKANIQSKPTQVQLNSKIKRVVKQHLSLDRSTLLEMTDQYQIKQTEQKKEEGKKVLKVEKAKHSKSRQEEIKQKPVVKFDLKGLVRYNKVKKWG